MGFRFVFARFRTKFWGDLLARARVLHFENKALSFQSFSTKNKVYNPLSLWGVNLEDLSLNVTWAQPEGKIKVVKIFSLQKLKDLQIFNSPSFAILDGFDPHWTPKNLSLFAIVYSTQWVNGNFLVIFVSDLCRNRFMKAEF